MKNNHQESFVRLHHILKALNDIETYTSTTQEDDFHAEGMLMDAVLFQFTIIGEAVQHVENEKLEKYDYPWFKVRAFRNFIAHEYFDINARAVWKIIRQEVPDLKILVEKIILNEF